MNRTALAIEQLKKDAKFTVGLDDDSQVTYLVKQAAPFRQILDNLADEIKTIRANSRLSFEAINEDVQAARQRAVDLIQRHASAISRSNIIDDLSRRVVSKAGTTRRANSEAQPGADALATELRQHVLPRLIAEGEGRQIPAPQTAAKMVLRAAERYAENPSKHETVIRALSVGWPFTEDLPVDVLHQVDAVIAEQVAPDELAQLQQAQGIQQALDRVAEAAQQDARGQG
jgi:hypothetical protein